MLRSLGRSGVADLVASRCRLARAIAEGLASAGLEIVNDVVLNQVLVRASNDDATSRLIAEVQSHGTCWCGPTLWDGRVAMRVSVSGWSTTDEDAARCVEAIVRALRRPSRGGR